MTADSGSGVLAIWNDIRTGREGEFEAWYKNEHFPERLSVPGFRLGRRYEAVAGEPRYFCYYITDTPETLTSAAYLERLNNPTALTRTMMTEAFANMNRTLCRRAWRGGVLRGAFSVTLRLCGTIDEASCRSFLAPLVAADGIARCEIWLAADQGSQVATEERLRGGDRKIAGCLLVDTLREEDARRVSEKAAAAFSGEAGIYRLLCEIEPFRCLPAPS
ncbi:MAG: hypothetical protein HXY30_20595 [Pseudorhodoplanes sp.]|nr:hypothetical protein [Pseudorhodoplanes sp.]